MADIYEIKLPNGRVVEFESDSPPSEAQESEIIAAEMGSAQVEKKRNVKSFNLDDSGTLAPGDNFGFLKPGEKFDYAGYEAVKSGDRDFSVDFDKKYSGAVGSALRAAGVEVPGAAAGAAAFGAAASNPGVRSLPPIGRVGIPLVAGLVGGVAGSFTGRKAADAISPEVKAQLEADQAQNPNAVLAGSIISQAPFFKPGLGVRVLERSVGAGIGGGIQAGQELANDAPLDADAAKRVFMATAGGAVFTDPTKLGKATMVAGGKASNSITSKLGNASTKSSVVQANAAANEIAAPAEPPGMATPPPIDQMGLLLQQKALADMPRVAGEPSAVAQNDAPLGMVEFPPNPLEGVRVDPLAFTRTPESLDSLLVPKPSAPAAGDTVLSQILQKEAGVSSTPEGTAIRQRLIEADKPKADLELKEAPAQRAAETTLTQRVDEAPIETTRSPELQASEQTRFNESVVKVQKNLANEGVELDRATAVKLARLADKPDEFNAARQQLIDSVKPKTPEIPEKGPIKSLEELPPKMGQDDATIPEFTEPAKPKVKRSKGSMGIVPEEDPLVGLTRRGVDAANEKLTGLMAKSDTEATSPAKTQKSDFDRYNEIQKQWAGLIKEGNGEGPEVQKLWAENEEIKNRHGGMPPPAPVKAGAKPASRSPEAMGVVPPEDPAVGLTRRGVNAANDKLTELMAKADVEASSPKTVETMFEEMFGAAKKSPIDQAEEVAFPKPGEGRSQSKEELARLKDVGKEEGMLTTYDTVTKRSLQSYRLKGEEPPAWMVENEKKNGEAIFAKLKKAADEVGAETPITPETAAQVAQLPEQYRPFLTDMADRWGFMNAPGLRVINRAVGKFATVIKRQLGRSMDNIGDVYSPLEGVLIKRDQSEGMMSNRWMARTVDNLGKKARESFSKEDFLKLEKAIRNREPEAAFKLFETSTRADELKAAYTEARATLDEIRDLLVKSGRDVGLIEDYFPARVADYEGLARHHGRDSLSKYEKALREFQRKEGRKATTEEKEKLINQILIGGRSGKGGPSFTKARTIDQVTDAELEFYEPFDIAMARYIREASKDIANSIYFGKIDPEMGDIDPTTGKVLPWSGESSFGKVVQEGIASGAIKAGGKGMAIIEYNMRDLFKAGRSIREDLSGLAAKARRAQTGLYLAQLDTALVQFLDILNIAREYGVTGALGAYGRKMPKVADIGVSEGHNIDIAEHSRAPKGSLQLSKRLGFQWALKNLLGRTDELQKSALIRAATKAVSKAIKDEDSHLFKQVNDRYSKMFPKEWPAMKEALASDDFAKGVLNDKTRLFLFAEMARLQPVSDAGRAQGYHAATPWGKLAYALRSYWLTQLGIIRRQAYNEIKKGTKEGIARGGAALMSYAALVAMGQQGFQYAKDQIFGRDDADAADYAIGGALQLMGVPRYALIRAGQTGFGAAALEALLPGTSALNDFGKDAYTLNKFMAGTQKDDTSKAVDGPIDFIQQLNSTKYAPVLGRTFYSTVGRGAKVAEREQERLDRGGDPRPGVGDLITDFFVPPDAKRR